MEIGQGNGKIYLGIPRERFYFNEFTDNRDSILESLQRDGLACGFYQASGHRVDRNRDRICEGFLGLKNKPEWLLMVDSDMEHVPTIGQRLAKHKKPIVGCLYFHRGDSHDPLVFRKAISAKDQWGRPNRLWAPLRDEVYAFLTKTGLPKYDGAVGINGMEADGLIEVDAIGTGGILIHRSVLETIPGPWFEYENGMVSEDLSFCDKAKYQYKIPVYCDMSTVSGHYKLSAMGQTQFRMKYEYRGMQYSSYSAEDAIKWTSDFLKKPIKKVEKLFMTGNGNEFGEYWKTLDIDTEEKELQAYRDPQSALPYMVELLKWNSSTNHIETRKEYMGIRNSKVIDLGAGIGTLTIQLAIQHNDVIAIEVNPVLQEFIKYRYNIAKTSIETSVNPITIMGDEWLTADIKNIEYAFALDVFEHLLPKDLQRVLTKLAEVMISGGKLFYHTTFDQQENFPMHHDYSRIWKQLLLDSGFYPLSDTVAQRM
jgi:2-polyprenyl-3-methyl-5-hydroxy-6-metoxy-1,4-benzoquinol methylase